MWNAFDRIEIEDLQRRTTWLLRCGPIQFSLRLGCLFLLTSFVALVIAVCFGVLAGLLTALTLAAMVWLRMYLFAPAPTKYLFVYSLAGLCLFSLLAMGLQRARMNAQHNHVVNDLSGIGLDARQRNENNPALRPARAEPEPYNEIDADLVEQP